MGLDYHPKTGVLVTADYRQGFKEPEMVKQRLVIVISPPIQARHGLCTIVPLSKTEPKQKMPYHALIDVPFKLPEGWGNIPRWVKGDMVNAVGFHRLDLLLLGKDRGGKRMYQTQPLPSGLLKVVRECVLHGMGLSHLTPHL